jgi:AraC-like DNA-binding protein
MTNVHRAVHARCSVPGIELVTLTSNQAFPKHAHDQFGVGVIRHGAHRSWSGRGIVEASQGDVIMVNPGEIHDGKPVDKQVRVWKMIYFDPQLVTGELRSEAIASLELIHPATSDPVLVHHFDRLFSVLVCSSSDDLSRDERIVQLLSRLLNNHTSAKERISAAPPVAKARERLESAPQDRLSLAELASLCDLTKFHFLRAFTFAFGITPHAYQLQKRTSRAKALLASGMSPAQAAFDAGFADQSHLTRTFVRQFGITPARYAASIH